MHIRRRHHLKSKGALLVLALIVGVPAVVWAYFSATTTQTNIFGAGTLYAPGALTTQHVEAVNNDGSVTLTWTETSGSGTLTPPSYQVMRATAGSSPSFSTVANLTAGSSNNSTTANCSGSTCTWTDNSTNDSSSPPGFNTQYEYEVQSYAGGFTAGPDSPYDALSMTPTSGTDTTGGITLNSVSIVGTTGTNAWLVGSSCSMEVTTNGTSWTQVTLSASVCPTGTNLTGVEVIDASDGWAVGSGGLILVCTASCTSSSATWADLKTEPTSQNLYAITAVAGGGPGNYVVLAVGASDTVVYCAAKSCSAAKSTFTSINPTNLSGDTLNSVSTVDGNEAWLAGTTGSGSGVISQCTSTANCETATGWAVTTSPSAPMTSVAGANAGPGQFEVYAVGNSGTVYVCTSNCQNASPSFSTVSGTGVGTTNLTDVALGDSNHAWLVGAGGFVGYCSNACNATSGGTWSTPSSSTTQNLNSLTAVNVSPGTYDVWAVGAGATVVYSSGGAYAGQSSGLGRSYTLQTADLANLQSINTTPSPYVTGSLPSSLPSSSSCSSSDLEVGYTPSVNGDPVGFAHAVVDYKLSSASSTSSRLLVSTNSGSTWASAGNIGTPSTSYQSVNVNVASYVGIVTTTAAQLQLCIQLAGSGGPTASIQQAHVDVDATPAYSASFTSTASTTFTVGSAGSFTVAANGQPSATITESGSLPSGVTFTGGTGTATLSGTPGAGTGGTYSITFTATNAIGTTNQSFTLTVDQAPTITSASSTTFTVASAGSFQVTTNGVPTPTFTDTSYSGCSASTLPSGVTFISSGLLAGTPGAGTAGTYTVCIEASNGIGSTATQQFTLTVSSLSFAGLYFTAVTQSGGSLSCSNQNTANVTCTAHPLGGTGSFAGEVELVNSSGTAVTNTSGASITVSATETTVSSPGGTVSPSSLTIANGSAATSSTFTLTGLGTGWSGTMTCTVTYGGNTYKIAVTGS